MASPSPSPKTAQHQPPSTPSVLHSLREFVTPTDLLLNVTGLVAAIVAGAAQPLMNIPFGNITSNFVQASPDSDALVQRTDHNVVYFLYLAAATFVAVYLCLGTWIYTGERITNRMRRAYFSKLLSQEVEFYSRRGAGSLTANMDSDFQNIQNGISEKVALNAMYLSCCIAGFAVAIIWSWRLGLSLLPMLPVLVAITLLFSHLAVKYTMGVIGAFARSSALIDESLSAIKTIHSLGAGPDILEKHRANVMQAHQQAQLRAWSVAGCMGAINFVIYSGYALAFFYGAILLRRGDIEAGIIITVFLSIMMGSFALAQIPNSIQTFVSAWSSLKSIQEVLHRVPAITSPPSPQKASLQRLIRFDSVDFTYPSRIDGPALSNFTLDIAAGKTTAIVGASGSFKSTLCALLVRLYDPQHGSVSLDGIDVRALDLRDLRGRCVSLVSQEAVLIQGSIVENVLSGLPPAEAAQLAHTGITAVLQARAREACIASDAHTFIMGLPQGYFTKVGTGGLQLSGGQRARLAIARALIRAPELLILDEATANLDMISESKVHASLRRSSAGRTTIVVAHRLSAIRGADHIVLMQSGKLVAQGTHQDLLRSADGVYRRLLQAAADDDDDGSDPIVPARPEQGGPEHDSAPADSEGEAEERSLEASDEAADKVSPAELRSTPSDKATPDQLNTHDVETGASSTSPSKPKAVSISPWTLFMKIAPASLGWITLGLVGCLGAGLAYPAFAIAYGQAFSTFSTDRYDAHEQTLNALWFFLIAIFGSAATAAHIIGLSEASTKFSSACRVKMLASLFRKPIAFFDEECNSAGHLAKIVCSAPEATEKVTGSTMGSFISSGITLLGGAVVALSYNWRFALVNLSVVPLTLLTGLCRLKVIDAKEQRLRAAHDPSTALASEAVSAFRTIVSLAQEDQIFQRFSAMLDQTRHFARRMALLDTAVFALAQTNMFFVIALGFWYGGRLISHGQLSQREFFVCFIAIVSGSFQCVNLLAQSPEVSQAKLAFSQICRVFEDDLSQPKPKDGTQPSQSSTMSLEKALEFDDVHFSFASRNKAVLRGVTFGCPAGSHIALCGPSGSGKTTAISLIERFYRPEKGVISLDGVDIDAIDLDVYRSSVSLVTQEPVLFSGTIEDNMLLGLKIENRDQGADKLDAAIRQALRDANLLTTVESLADGIKTDLGSKGVNLSGGQRQRLALARALLKQPKLLLLDEATSSLDYENQAAVQAALDAASQSQDRTTVSVVHRLETLRNVPHIAVMQDGCIVEEGTFDSLTKKQGGLFARMLSSADRNARS